MEGKGGLVNAAGWWLIGVFCNTDVAVIVVVAVWIILLFLQVLSCCSKVRAIVVVFFSELIGDER